MQQTAAILKSKKPFVALQRDSMCRVCCWCSDWCFLNSAVCLLLKIKLSCFSENLQWLLWCDAWLLHRHCLSLMFLSFQPFWLVWDVNRLLSLGIWKRIALRQEFQCLAVLFIGIASSLIQFQGLTYGILLHWCNKIIMWCFLGGVAKTSSLSGATYSCSEACIADLFCHVSAWR